MPIPSWRFNPDGSLIPFTDDDVDRLQLQTRGIRDGSGGRRSFRQGSSTRNYKWFCDPAYFWDACVYLYGAVSLVTDAGTGNTSLSRIMPWTDADDEKLGITGIDTTWHKFVRDAGTAAGGVPVPTYDRAEIDTTAEILPFELQADAGLGNESDRYVERLADEGGAKYLTLPGVNARLYLKKPDGTGPSGAAGGTPVNYNVGLPYIVGKVRRKIWRVPRDAVKSTSKWFKRIYGDPDGATAADRLPFVNTVNKFKYDGFAIGTLILQPPKVEPQYDPIVGDWCVNITLEWDWVPNGGYGANYLYWGETNPGWWLSTRGPYAAPGAWADTDVTYPARDHRDCFNFGDP